jgi:hypothetical protein
VAGVSFDGFSNNIIILARLEWVKGFVGIVGFHWLMDYVNLFEFLY